MSAACQKDTVLPRVSSAVGRPVCVCETYLHPLHRENVYSLRLASRHWPRHHHSPSGQDALRTDRGTRTARTEGDERTPLASPPRTVRRGLVVAGRTVRAAAAERNGELSYLARDRGEARKRPNETSPDVCARKNFAHRHVS